MGVRGVDSNLATAVRTSVVVIFTWVIAAGVGAHGAILQLSRRNWAFLAASGIATGLSWLCYFRALSEGQASKVAPVDKLSVVFVILLAWPLLGERITMAKVWGGLLITAGAVVLAIA
jgi:transporter family protein